MPFDDFSKFLQAATDAGELERIAVPLRLDQEIAALTHQICREFRETSPVLLFEEPIGSRLPVVTNLLGNETRFLRSLGAERYSDVVARLRAALDPFPANRDWKFGLSANAISDRSKSAPRLIRRALCQQVIKLGDDVDLGEFPILRCWAEETGPAITAGQVITADADGRPAVELMPLEVVDRQTLRLHWNPQGPCARRCQTARQQHRQLPVAISLGGDPLLTYVASLPLPDWLDPWYFAGILRSESLNLIRARSVELNVPADGEIVLEGYLDPQGSGEQGVTADVLGNLQTLDGLPALTLSAVTHRANPLFPARIQAFDWSEELVTSRLTEKLLLGLLQLTQRSAVDLHLPQCGMHRQVVFVGCSAGHAAEVQQILQSAAALPLISAAPLIVAVDADVDVRETDLVWREVVAKLPPLLPQISSLVSGGGTRLLINATDFQNGVIERRCRPAPEILEDLAKRLRGRPGPDQLHSPVGRRSD